MIFWVHIALLVGSVLGLLGSFYVWKLNRKLDDEFQAQRNKHSDQSGRREAAAPLQPMQ